MIQSVSDWQKNKGSSAPSMGQIQSVADWSKNVTLTPEPPSLTSKIISGVKDYAQASANTVDTLGNAILHPIDTLKKVPNLFVKPLIAGEKMAGEGLATIFDNYGMTPKTTVPEKVAGVANVISGLAQSAFSPITGIFTVAQNTPGLKQVADLINVPFSTAGMAGAWSSGKIVDAIPDSILSQTSKDIIKQPIQDVSSLAFQVLLGGKIMEKIGVLAKDGKEITPEETKKIVVQSQNEAHQIAISTPGTRYADYRKSQGYEPYTPPDQLPTIDMGTKPVDNTLPTIQTEVPTSNKLGSMTVEPIKPVPKPMSVSEWVSAGKPEKQIVETQPVLPETKTITPPQSDISITSQKIIQKANELGLQPDFSNVPTIERMKLAEESVKAQDFVSKNPSEAMKVLDSGDTSLRPQSIFVELKKKAFAEGDVSTIMKLAESKIGTETAQSLKALDDGLRLNADPVKEIQNINTAWEKKVLKDKPKQQVIKEETANLPKIEKVKGQTWNEFIDSIIC